MLEYKAIEIFTNEEARWHGKPLGEAIVNYIASLKIAARCIVTKGTDGCYESGEIVTRRLEILSYNMPVRIFIILPAAEYEALIGVLQVMVTDGIVAAHPLDVISHRTRNRQIPRQLRVRDVMTGHPKTITLSARADKVAELLLSSRFTGVPVIDDENHPIGIITESDLIYRAGMPMRLGLLSKYDAGRKSAVLADLSTRTAEEIMTKPAVCIEESKLLNDAVALMLRKKVNRLPVVNALYEVVGILSRVDVFRAIMHEAPDWKSFVDQNVIVENLRSVSDIMCRDTLTVSPGLPIEEVVRTAESKDFLGLPVVDDNGRFLGLLSDQDMLEEILFQNGGMFKTLIGRLPFTQAGKRRKELGKTERGRAASEIMNRETPTIHESATIEEAIELMVRTGTKRLPVVDAEHKYKGMLSREVLLRTVLTDS